MKGGTGTTVVATTLALLARRGSGGALLADLAGDAAAALGVAEPPSPGIAGWLAAGSDVPADGLARLEVPVAEGLALLPRGEGPLGTERADVLAALLATDGRAVVADCGTDLDGAALAVAGAATRSVLVIRPCFLALRRIRHAVLRPSEVVLVDEPGRALHARDVEDVVGAPIVARVPYDPGVARAVDAGLLSARLPRSLQRELSGAA
ncbi:MAG: hypothetical protein AB7L84_02240 [Acidimicrobiia bacterium]